RGRSGPHRNAGTGSRRRSAADQAQAAPVRRPQSARGLIPAPTMKAILSVALSLSKGASRMDAIRRAKGHGAIGKRALPALLAAPLLCGMAPGDMSVAAFLARANAVTRLGPLAMATPDAYRLKNEVIATARRYKARIDAQR